MMGTLVTMLPVWVRPIKDHVQYILRHSDLILAPPCAFAVSSPIEKNTPLDSRITYFTLTYPCCPWIDTFLHTRNGIYRSGRNYPRNMVHGIARHRPTSRIVRAQIVGRAVGEGDPGKTRFGWDALTFAAFVCSTIPPWSGWCVFILESSRTGRCTSALKKVARPNGSRTRRLRGRLQNKKREGDEENEQDKNARLRVSAFGAASLGDGYASTYSSDTPNHWLSLLI